MLCSARELKLSDDHAPARAVRRRVPGADIRSVLALTTPCSPQAHAQSGAWTERVRHRPRGGGPHRRAAQVPTFARCRCGMPTSCRCGRGARVVRPLLRPHRAPGGYPSKTPAWMIDRLARWAALGQRAGGYLQLRDVRVRPTLAHLRSGQDPRPPGGALGGRAKRSSCSMAVRSSSTPGRRDRDAQASSRWPHHGRRCHAVSGATRNVYVEAAFWWPDAVAGRSRRFNFNTDAGHRFERGVDPALTVR